MLKPHLLIAIFAIGSILITSCSQKQQNSIATITTQKICTTPIVSYQINSISAGQFNDLQITNEQILPSLKNALQQTNCFIENNNNPLYNLKLVYGSIATKNTQGGFWSSTSKDSAIIELQIAFTDKNEERIFTSKAFFENTKDHYLGLGDSSKLQSQHIQDTLSNAIHSIANQAAQNFMGF